MAVPMALRALGGIWFRFLDEEDQGKYGSDWLKYDEGAILRMRARDLIALETDLGMPLVALMNGFRQDSILGDTAAAWLGVRAVDPARAGDFDEFNPITALIEWSKVNPDAVPKDEPGNMPAPEESSSPMASESSNTISAPTATVALDIMPVAE
jgi:hypothetical protein